MAELKTATVVMDSVFDAKSVSEYLRRELDRRLSVNPRYSLRAFAKHLGMSPGELSEILREKRPISAKACQKVARAMDLSPTEFKHLLVLSATSETPMAAPVFHPSNRLGEDHFRLISDWWCFALISLLDLEDVRWERAVIAKKLGITPLQAQGTMERLERLGLVRRGVGGHMVST
ncbi:MAG: DUF4423 domain-containing protein, partial [Bdellovibrionales bacterium]|nr:DUF4423 domain-containing protein [Bdellovibrionales bacterium]